MEQAQQVNAIWRIVLCGKKYYRLNKIKTNNRQKQAQKAKI